MKGLARRIGVVTSLLMAAVLLAPGAAGAAVTTSQITSPADPTFVIYDTEAPQQFGVSGTTDGGAGDNVDLLCFSDPTDAWLLASDVPVNADGSFSDSSVHIERAEYLLCRLRAVPAGSTPSPPEQDSYSGPLLGIGATNRYTVGGTGVNAGLMFDFYLYGQQLDGGFDYYSLGSCGLYDGYLFNSAHVSTTTTFYCSDYLAKSDEPGAGGTRSELQVDGANAYTPYSAAGINDNAPGISPVSFSYSQDPQSGDLTIHETDEIVKCPDATFPPTTESCPSFVDTGVQVERMIVQDHDGLQATITDRFLSADGNPHTLDLLWQNDQYFSGSNIAYRFPGESAAATHDEGDVVTLPSSAPATIYLSSEGTADGDKATGRGAITYDRPASSATFNGGYGTSNFNLRQAASIPAGGSTVFRAAYSQAYTQAEVDALAKEAEQAFTPPPPPTQTPPVAVPIDKPQRPIAKPSKRIRFGKLKLNRRRGTAKLQVKVPGPGRLLLFGRQVKRRRASVKKASTAMVAIVPKGKLKRRLRKRGRAKTTVSVSFTPTGGSARVVKRKLKLVKTKKRHARRRRHRR